MNSIIQQITDWLKGILVSGIMDNLTNTFSSVNDQVGQIATEVGKTPSNFMPAVFNMVRNLSESVIMPVAGILLTFIACYELIQLIISYNNLASFETWFIWKWIFKTFVAVELITHTFDITMAVFDVSQSVVRQAGGIIQGSTAVDASTLATMQSTLEAMELGPLFAIFLQSFIVQFLMYVLSAVIFVIINGRMVEIYLMVSLAPLPFATFGNREQSMMGQNYMRSLFALGFQGFLIMVCVGIYAVLIQSVAFSTDLVFFQGTYNTTGASHVGIVVDPVNKIMIHCGNPIQYTVNFRTYKESYKDKHSKMTPKEDLVIFENTQEAIIDKETWERVQTLRKTIRRTDTIGTANPLTGLMFCADCGAKMYNHRGKAGNARDWAGRPTGKKRPDCDEYNCSRYDLGNQHFDDYCTTHLIRTAVVNELLLEAIKEVCDYAQNNEAEFMAQVCSASEDRQAKAAKAIRQRKQRSEKRTDELSRLIRKLYEDNVNGRLSDKLFEQMLHDFEAELEGLTDSITQDQQELDRISRETVNAEKFLALVKKYTDFSELTPAMINEFVEKILVHQAEGKGASRTQEVEIFFNFIGKVEIPRKEIELTEEEKAALAEQERRRAKKAEYNRRYMEKKRRQWKEQQEREKEQQEALELPAASTEKGERIA